MGLIWWCIVFFPSCFYIANSFSDVCFSTNTNSSITFTRSLSLKRVFIFLVSHFIQISYLSLVNLLNFLINCLEATSFLSQYGISVKITGGLTSKKTGGMIKSMFLWLFSLFRKSLHSLFINLDGTLAARNFFLICTIHFLESVAIHFAQCKSPLIAFLL